MRKAPSVSSVSTPQPIVNPAGRIFITILRCGALLALAIAFVGGIAGYFAQGWVGVVSALIGTGMALFFLGLTAVSILVANRFGEHEFATIIFFSVVLGVWLLKFVLFLVLLVLLKDQPFIDNIIMFISLVAGVLGSLVVDVVVMAKSRIPYVGDVRLPDANPTNGG
jgi:hypothetical protein